MGETLLPMGPTVRLTSMQSDRDRKQYSARRPSLRLFWTMMTLIALAPLPLGSNRPIFWGLSAFAIGVTLFVWSAVNSLKRRPPAVSLSDIGSQSWLFFAFISCLVVQMLPISPWVGVLASSGLGNLTVPPQTISLSPGDTLLMLLRQLTYGGAFFLMLQIANRDSLRSKSLDVLLIIITGYAIVGLASLRMGDTLLGMPKWAYLGSATATFVNRNSFATFEAFGAVLAMTQLMDLLDQWMHRSSQEWNWRHNASDLGLYLSSLLIILAAVVASQSRMGFLVTMCGMSVVVACAVWRNRRMLLMALMIIALGLVAISGVLLVYGKGLIERMDVLEKSSSVRLHLYQQVIELIGLRPWLGFGGGAFELAFPLVHRSPVSGNAVWDKAHNSYLALFSEMGLIAGMIPIVLLALIGFRILGSLLRNKGSWRSQTAALAVIAVGAVHSTVDFSLEIQANTLMFLSIISLGYASALKSQR